ncbi:uncharacterized protein TNCV_4109981 [Trichonephila clavipes]|nr:uncharacterized protein TNCV_4109981 [Trichonephila clavipes]
MTLIGLRAARGLLTTGHVILKHDQVTWTTPELAPPLLTTTPHQREEVSALDRFNVHRCPSRRVFSGRVISEPDLLSTTESEILEGFSDQGVIQIRRITIKKIQLLFRQNI